MYERIVKNWKTTLIGVVIIGAAIYTVIIGLCDWKEASFGAVGFLLSIFKDPKKKDDEPTVNDKEIEVKEKEVEQLKKERDDEIHDIRNSDKSGLDGKLSNFRENRN